MIQEVVEKLGKFNPCQFDLPIASRARRLHRHLGGRRRGVCIGMASYPSNFEFGDELVDVSVSHEDPVPLLSRRRGADQFAVVRVDLKAKKPLWTRRSCVAFGSIIQPDANALENRPKWGNPWLQRACGRLQDQSSVPTPSAVIP